MNHPRGHVSLEGVTFGYEPGRAVLHDISLEAKPGEIVALVGHTGAGKSTLVSLIARLYDPWQGTVRFDGIDLRQLQLRSLRDNIAFVMQEPFLFRVTVAENIAYGRPAASRDEIIAAAKAAAADAFIRRLPQGYDTIIGERGATLSGGEKQRLSIARALEGRPGVDSGRAHLGAGSRDRNELARGDGAAHARADDVYYRASTFNRSQGRSRDRI